MAEHAEQLERVAAARAEARPRNGRGTLRLALGLLGLLVAGGSAAWHLGRAPRGAAAPTDVAAAGPAAAAPARGALHAFEPFIASLRDEDGKRYLKATLQLEFFDASPPAEFEAHVPELRDLLLGVFTGAAYSEMRTPEGRAALREDIVDRVNRTLGDDLVKAVHFTELVVQ